MFLLSLLQFYGKFTLKMQGYTDSLEKSSTQRKAKTKRRKAKLFSAFAFLLFTFSVSAQTPAERGQRIRAALDAKNYSIALQELTAFRSADAKIFALNNYDYLLARIAEKRGDSATANANYQSVINRNSVLTEYALWHLSQIARASGNLMLERTFLQQLSIVAPDSLLAETANRRIAGSYFESGDFAATIQSLKVKNPQSAIRSPQTEDREKLTLLGESLRRGGNAAGAREVFTNLIKNLPNAAQPDDFALAAAKNLDELDAAKPEDYGKIAPQLPDYEHLRRALIYSFNRDFADARLHYAAIVERYPQSGNKPDALLQLGRIANLENKFDAAIPFFERVQAEFPAHPAAKDALSFKASAYSRLGNADEAVGYYEEFIAKYVDNGAEAIDNPERPFLNIVDVLRDAGKDAAALEWIQKIRERFNNQMPAALALFSGVRIHLSQGDFNRTLRDLTELETAPDLGGMRTPGGTNKQEIAFLKAFCLEQLRRETEAFNGYLSIPDGRGDYYGGRATERLKAMSADERTRDFIAARLNLFRQNANQSVNAKDFERARQSAQTALRLTGDAEIRREMLDVARRAYEQLPAYKNVPNGKFVEFGRQKLVAEKPIAASQNFHRAIADELLFLNIYDEAAPELEAGLKSQVQSPKPESADKGQTTKDEGRSFTLAVLYKRADLAHKSVLFAEPLWRNVPADYLLELAPRESVELLYPAPYSESLLNFAAPRKVDPRFVLSIMRQESRYRADVKSYAAARGLMQFISTTSNPLAKELNLPNFRQNDLYDAPTAILFGSQYLANIFRQFPNQPQAVAASYNGGETNMLRWLVRSRTTDADRYVAEIQFTQSKDYVYKVLANYRAYQTLYDEQLRRR